MKPSVGIVIPTYQAEKHLPHCLPSLIASGFPVLVIDSSSTDKTIEIAHSMGAMTHVIPKSEFNHGATREMGRQMLNTSIVVMITQDAYPTSPEMVEQLIKPLLNNEASIAYGRQLPHQGASLLAAFSREFNYPSKSHNRSLKDIETYGIYTFFCSNSCAAYLNSALNEIGGFPTISFGEDTAVTAKLLHQGHRIAYVAEAEVHHSHDYTLYEEFKRHVEMASARQDLSELLSVGGKESERGKIYVKSLLKHLASHSPKLIPYAFLQIMIKWFGFQTGKIVKKTFY